jgi:hypothetical protein
VGGIEHRGLGVFNVGRLGTEIVSSIVMYNLGVGQGGPYISANLEGPRSIYM